MNISVAICTYNGQNFIKNQLDSILSQTKCVTEIVLCDDNSIDSTFEIIEEYKNKFPSVFKIYRNETNLGGKKNFEKAFSQCTGDIVFFSDQDDVWNRDKVARMLAEFEANPDVWGIGSNASLIDENGNRLPGRFWDSLDFAQADYQQFQNEGLFRYILHYGNMVAGAMLAIKREARNLIFPFKFLDEIWHDEWIIIALSATNRFRLLDEDLIQYRLHENQQIGLGATQQGSWIEYKKTLKNPDSLLSQPMLIFTNRWQAYQRIIRYSEAVPELKPHIPKFATELREAKKAFLDTLSYPTRKARLLKWLIFGEFATSAKELLHS